jgi:hypothetical protein
MNQKFLILSLTLSLFIGVNQHGQAQFLKKLKDAATGTTTPSTSTSAPSIGGSSKMIGDKEISDEFTTDEYGLNGIYYAQTKNGITKNKFQFEVCKDKSTAKGAENMPGCLFFHYEIPESNSNISKGKFHNDGYAHPENLIRTKSLYFAGNYFGDMFQIEPGVILMSPNNAKGAIGGAEPWYKKDNFDWKYFIEYGFFYVKNKEDLKKWTYSAEVEDKVRTALNELNESISSIYSEVEGKKNANNEMPSMGKLNSKFIQDRALKTYKEKYEPINKGWTHDYMYVHGNDWVNKKKYLPNGQQVESHRELQVVIVRRNPQGQCKADLMYYVEIFENGKYDAANGKVTGPVSYIGMPGGYLPCEKSEAFKSKLAK